MNKSLIVMFCMLVLVSTTVNAQAEEQWVARYDNLSQWDQAEHIEVDDSGNAYVTGFSYGEDPYDWVTIKYGSDGTEQWLARYENGVLPEDMAVDGAGNVYVTGSTSDYDYPFSLFDQDCVVIKYSSSGTKLWEAKYNGPFDGNDSGRAVAVDGDGNVYVAGSSYGGPDTRDDWVIIKYDVAGVEQWTVRYDGPLGTDWGDGIYYNKDDRPVDIALDAAGNVYVTGTSMAWTGEYARIFHSDVTTIKFNSSSGNVVWEARYDGPSQYGTWDRAWDAPYALELDSDGNVYIAGQTSRQFNADLEDGDWLVLKYDSNGVQQWVVVYDEAVDDLARDLTVDASGNVYVAGYSDDEDTDEKVWLVAKYDSAGNELWMQRYHGSANNDAALALALDGSANVYVTGITYNGSYNYDWMTIKYDSAGNEQWQEQYGGSANSGDHALDIGVDGSGNAYVTGYSQHDTSADFTTIKYGASAPDDDADGDGIHNDVDTLPDTFSDDFSDGTTTGTITDRGDQVLTVTDSEDPVEGVTVAAADGTVPATVSGCGGIVTYDLDAGDEVIVTCGSVTTKVIKGTVEITFFGPEGTTATTSLDAGCSLLFEPDTFTFTAPPDNSCSVVVLIEGKTLSIEPGESKKPVEIDVKPGSDPNCLNINGHGVIPVAILGSANLDVMDIKTDDSLSFNGLEVRVRGKKGPLCSVEDSNGDEFLDLVCHFEDNLSEWLEGDEQDAILEGELLDGTLIQGTDSICIVP